MWEYLHPHQLQPWVFGYSQLAAGNALQTQDAPTQHLVQESRLMRPPTCTKCVGNDLLFEEWAKAEQGWFLDPNRLETVHKGDGHVFIVGRKGVRVRVIALLVKVVRFETPIWAKGWSNHTFSFLFAQIAEGAEEKVVRFNAIKCKTSEHEFRLLHVSSLLKLNKTESFFYLGPWHWNIHKVFLILHAE